MPRFEFKKFVELPVDVDQVYETTIFMVGRFVGTSFRKVVTFTDYSSAKKFVETYSGLPDQFVSDFIIYRFDLSCRFPDKYNPEKAFYQPQKL